MSDACRDGLPVSCQCGCGEVGHRIAHGVVTSAVKTSMSATSDSSSSLSSRPRCANSSSVSTFRVPNRAGRWSGTPTISTPGQNPCRSGSPHGVLGWTKPGAGWGMGSAAAPAAAWRPAGRWAVIADADTNATRRARSDLFMSSPGRYFTPVVGHARRSYGTQHCRHAPGRLYATARHIPWNPREIARQAESCAGTAGVGRGPYFGPAAPVGPRYHHYVFELYALSGISRTARRRHARTAPRRDEGQDRRQGRLRPPVPPVVLQSASPSAAGQSHPRSGRAHRRNASKSARIPRHGRCRAD